jgi:PAS domain S-box-containing protein
MSTELIVPRLPEWRQIAEALPNIVWATRPNGHATFFNQRWYAYTGLTPQESAADGWTRAVHHDDLAETLQNWRAAVLMGKSFEAELRFRRYDGVYRWFLARANPVRDRQGRITRWFGTCTDIDLQKRSEEAYAELYRRERRIADTLQRALLPPALPRVPGLTLDAVYQPDTDEGKVGGDWYDAFDLGDGRIAFSIGDVAGHGLGAAVLMGRVREALRAAAIEGHDPGRVLQLANGAVELSESQTIVTAIFAILDRLTLRLYYASAGHPPLLLANRDDTVEFLCGRGLPLGLGIPNAVAEGWQTHAIALNPSSIIAFYTDGLTESDRDISAAEKRMAEALARQARGMQQRSALSLVASTIRGRQRDDIAVLTVATSSTPLREIELTLPANPGSAQRARHIVARVMREARVEAERAFNFQVAVGEAVNNAIEHAAKLGSEEFVLHARRRQSAITVEVADHGTWRAVNERPAAPDPLAPRGRGLALMHALSDDVHLEQTGDGTTVRLALRLAA